MWTMMVADPQCWVILASAVVCGVAALYGLLSERYRDGWLECVALASQALHAAIVAIQIGMHGYAHASGVVGLMASMAAVALVRALYWWHAPPQYRPTGILAALQRAHGKQHQGGRT